MGTVRQAPYPAGRGRTRGKKRGKTRGTTNGLLAKDDGPRTADCMTQAGLSGDARAMRRLQPLRAALLGTAAAGLMVLGYGRSVYAQVSPPTPPCNQISGGGTTVTCTGDVSNGILVDGDTLPYTTLNVETIAGDITPGAGINGINFYNTNGNDITINTDTGDRKITTENAWGIRAVSSTGNIAITHRGDIEVNGGGFIYGISARSRGSVDINFKGDITNNGTGRFNDAITVFADGGIAIVSEGRLQAGVNEGYGIFALAGNSGIKGDVYVKHTGDIFLGDNAGLSAGIGANVSNGGDATLKLYGNTYGGFRGIGAFARAPGTDSDNPLVGGDIFVTIQGNVTTSAMGRAGGSAVVARSGAPFCAQNSACSTGNVHVVVHGDIVVNHDAPGIYASSNQGGTVYVYHKGDITTSAGTDSNHGITIEGASRATLAGLQSIAAKGIRSDVTLVNIGDITTTARAGAEHHGIYATTRANNLSITQIGDITTHAEFSEGMDLRTGLLGEEVTVVIKGDISTEGDGSSGIHILDLEGDPAIVPTIVSITQSGNIVTSGDTGFKNPRTYYSDGIHVNLKYAGGDVFIKTYDGSITSKLNRGIYIRTRDGNASVEIASVVTGGATSYGGGNTVAVDLRNVAGTNRVELQPGFGFNGIVDARNNGTNQPVGNRLVFGGPSGQARLDLSQISADLTEDAGEVFFGFDNVFLKEDQSNFIFEGENQDGAEYDKADVTGGLALLASNGRLRMASGATPFTVSGGGLGAIGDGGVLDGNVSVGPLGSIVLSNEGPFDPASGLYGTGDILRIAGNFQSNSGAFYLDTFLNDGVVDITDQLVIGGNTSGTTRVFVSNAGGIGGFTGRGAGDGIKIVDVGGTSNGQFVLGADVIAGAFEYDLNQANGQDWFLQSHLRDIAVMAAYVPYTLQTLGRELTGTYYERTGTRIGWQDGDGIVGETASMARAPGRPNGGGAAEPLPSAGWVRALGAWSDVDGSLLNGRNDVSYEEDFWALQGGFDGVAYEDARGTLIASIFGQYAYADANARNDFANRDAGTTETEGWGGGLALTYAALNGLYLDGVTTYTRYDIDLRSPRGDRATANAGNWTVSGEAGWHVPIGRNLAMTPQAQLLYQDVGVGGTTDSRGVVSSFSETESLEGRIGTTLEYTNALGGAATNVMPSAMPNALPMRLYGEFNVVHAFLDDPSVDVGGTTLALGFEETGYEVGGGFEIGQRGGGLAAWVEADYRAPFDTNDGIQTWAFTGGATYRF